MPGELLAANNFQASREPDGAWEEPDAVVDVVFAAGLLGLLAGLLAVGRLGGTHFPDAVFWRALPLLLTIPPGLFLAALCAPGGLVEPSGGGISRAARFALGGLLSYIGPIACLSILAALAGVR